MSLYRTIKYIYPDINDNKFELQSNGNTSWIESWSYEQAEPTQTELDNNEQVAEDYFNLEDETKYE